MKQLLPSSRSQSGRSSFVSDTLLGLLLVAALIQITTCFDAATNLLPDSARIQSGVAMPALQTNSPLVTNNGASQHENS